VIGGEQTAAKWFRHGLLVPALLLLSSTIVSAQTAAPLTSDIPSQSLPQALALFARQTGLQIVYLSGVIREQRSPGAPAGLAPEAALTHLLAGTGLRFEYLNARSIRILPAPAPAHERATPTAAAVISTPTPEVIVTASSINPTMERVPVSLTVWSAEDLQTAQINDAASLARLTPGVEFDAYQDYSAGIETNISIRGINARDGSTVALFLDDIPIPSDRLSSFGRAFPPMFDLERIEILRGPQGTLLGEGAEGGAVRFITAQPNLRTFDGFTRAQYALTENGGPTYDFGGALGGPLIPGSVGFRVSAWSRRDGGFVDRVDPFTGATVDANANRNRREAFSGALTFAPTDAVQITPAIRYQTLDVHDSSAFYSYLSDPGAGVLNNGKLLAQPYSDAYRVLSLRIEADLGFAQLREVSAYLARWACAIWDATNVSTRNFPNPLGPEYPVSYADAVPTDLAVDQYVESHQLTLSSSMPGAHMHWVAGAEYVHAHYAGFQDLATLALDDGGNINGRIIPQRGTLQIAGFAQTDVQLPERLTATLGLRVERASYDSDIIVNSIGTPVGGEYPQQELYSQGSNTPVALRVALAFQQDPDRLFYASASDAYRMGGSNVTLGALCALQTPATYDPDTVWSFEVGAKSSWADGRVQIDGSVFHMLWRDLQMPIPVPQCGFGYLANAGAARSDGFDLSARARLTDRLDASLTLAYADARYTQSVYLGSQVVANDGDAIGAVPLVAPPLAATATVDYRIFSAPGITGTLHVQDSYQSRNHGPFTTNDPNAVIYAPERTADPPTNRLDLGFAAQRRQLELSAFLNNAFNAQPTLQRRNRSPGDTLFYATTFRPRTVGLAVTWRFGSAARD
jgi:outer membrane receptor protein involved in Fe transport